jgi:hypothetical protein
MARAIRKIHFKKHNIVDLMAEIIMKINQIIARLNQLDRGKDGKDKEVQVLDGN